MKGTQCLNLFPKKKKQPTTVSKEDRDLWGYQACTEMLFPFSQTSKGQGIFWDEKDNFTATVESCKKIWGVTPKQNWANMYLGGKAAVATMSNVVFSNGLLDPWSAGGVTWNISSTATAVVLRWGGHHVDLMFSHPGDTQDIKDARQHEMNQIQAWVDNYRAKVNPKPSAHIPSCSQCVNGECWKDAEGLSYCNCKGGWKGPMCSAVMADDMCTLAECENGGVCHKQLVGVTKPEAYCLCPAAFTGTKCQHAVPQDPCTPSPCKNNGKCSTFAGQPVCVCQKGYQGKQCEMKASSAIGCKKNYCQNNGNCSVEYGKPFCTCAPGWRGTTCATKQAAWHVKCAMANVTTCMMKSHNSAPTPATSKCVSYQQYIKCAATYDCPSLISIWCNSLIKAASCPIPECSQQKDLPCDTTLYKKCYVQARAAGHACAHLAQFVNCLQVANCYDLVKVACNQKQCTNKPAICS
eukprot:TRINITY_DN60828_c0_g2_i1.p1 TRINITY_DN60828_c0_g2~~TRINITY_DN60828_c0_g2_i1.p1  ORF type:complete len:542 (-),score=53.79 TRINITY_DN60828_c0_g2_i1:89-1483(-)